MNNQPIFPHDFVDQRATSAAATANQWPTNSRPQCAYDDQVLPIAIDGEKPKASTFFYVNKDGYILKSHITNVETATTSVTPTSTATDHTSNSNSGHILDGNNHQDKQKAASSRNPHVSQSVPSCSLKSLNVSCSELALVQRDMSGRVCAINTQIAMDEPHVEIDYDQFKYINIFSILCCWCFPFTGIFSIVFARMATNYYRTRDLVRAKKYLKKSEWMLILTFFFGFTFIAIGFAFIEAMFFKTNPNQVSKALFQTRALV